MTDKERIEMLESEITSLLEINHRILAARAEKEANGSDTEKYRALALGNFPRLREVVANIKNRRKRDAATP